MHVVIERRSEAVQKGDGASQNHLREPRELARVARSGRAACIGLRRGRTPRLSTVRAPLLRLRPRSLHDIRRSRTLSAPTREKRHRRGVRGACGNGLRTAATRDLLDHMPSASRQTVAEVPLTGLSFAMRRSAGCGLSKHLFLQKNCLISDGRATENVGKSCSNRIRTSRWCVAILAFAQFHRYRMLKREWHGLLKLQ